MVLEERKQGPFLFYKGYITVNNLEKFHQKAHLILVAKISPMYNLELIRSPRRQAQDLFLCFIFYFLVNNIIRREF